MDNLGRGPWSAYGSRHVVERKSVNPGRPRELDTADAVVTGNTI